MESRETRRGWKSQRGRENALKLIFQDDKLEQAQVSSDSEHDKCLHVSSHMLPNADMFLWAKCYHVISDTQFSSGAIKTIFKRLEELRRPGVEQEEKLAKSTTSKIRNFKRLLCFFVFWDKSFVDLSFRPGLLNLKATHHILKVVQFVKILQRSYRLFR